MAVSLNPGGTFAARQLDANVAPLALEVGCLTTASLRYSTRGSTADFGEAVGNGDIREQDLLDHLPLLVAQLCLEGQRRTLIDPEPIAETESITGLTAMTTGLAGRATGPGARKFLHPVMIRQPGIESRQRPQKR
mgnify:CR=1 FL=1